MMGPAESKSDKLEGNKCAPAPARWGLPFTCTFASNPNLLHILSQAFIHTEGSKKKKDPPHLSCNFAFDVFQLHCCLPFRLLLLFSFFFHILRAHFPPPVSILAPFCLPFFIIDPCFFSLFCHCSSPCPTIVIILRLTRL